MDINKLKGTLSDIASVTAEKAEELAEQAKLRASIADISRNLSKAYMEIGKLMTLEEAEREASFDATLAHHISKARQLKIVLMQRKNELSKAKQTLTCPVCLKKTSIDHAYCPFCGTPLLMNEDEA